MLPRNSLLALLLLTVAAAGGALLPEPRPGAEMTAAAIKFLETLNAEQIRAARMEFDDPRRLDWHFIPKDQRKGLQLREMSDQQKQAARALLAACLSEVGYEKASTITELEKILEKLEGERARFRRDYLRYYFTIFGQPSLEGKWGLSIEGHHLSLNFVVDQGRVTAHTPAMFGANPAVVQANVGVGPKRGTRVLAQEELLAFQLLGSLSGEQKAAAIIAEKAPDDIRGPVGPQPPLSPPEGLPAAKMNTDQVATLQALIEAYIKNMPDAVASARLAEIEKAGIEKVYFAWAGAQRPGVGHYYRVQGPTFLIEFVNVQPDAAGNPANHIHSVWRNLGGDFGIPLK